MKYHTLLAIVILAISASPAFSKGGEQGGMKSRLDNLEQRLDDVSTLIGSLTGNPNDLIMQRLNILERRLNAIKTSKMDGMMDGMMDKKGKQSLHTKVMARLDALEQRLNKLLNIQTTTSMDMSTDTMDMSDGTMDMSMDMSTDTMDDMSTDPLMQRLNKLEQRLKGITNQATTLPIRGNVGIQHDILVNRLDKMEQRLDDMQNIMGKLLQSMTNSSTNPTAAAKEGTKKEEAKKPSAAPSEHVH